MARKRSSGVFRPEKLPPRVELTVQGRKLQLKRSGDIQQGGGTRRKVQTFTAQSRKRLIDLLARIDFEQTGFIAFLTLTYPDREGPPCPSTLSRDLATLKKRLMRISDRISGMWRKEWEPRKSGRYQGILFPHFHFLLFGLPYIEKDELRTMWSTVIGYDGYVRTRIEAVRSAKHATHYVTKYMGKLPKEIPSTLPAAEASGAYPNGAPGASAGDSGEAASGVLVSITYLTDKHHSYNNHKKGSFGRHWGVINRKKIPLAPIMRAHYPSGKWLDEAHIIRKSVYDSDKLHPLNGFTIYSDEAQSLFKKICDLADPSESTGEDQ